VRTTALPAALLVAGAITACDSAGDNADTYPSGTADASQIEYVVDQFNRAAEDLDGSWLCAEVIAPSARGGSVARCAEPIDSAMEEEPDNWGQLTELAAIEVDEGAATAEAIQDGASITLTFTREEDRWWMEVFD
jgi:hypothetical protein